MMMNTKRRKKKKNQSTMQSQADGQKDTPEEAPKTPMKGQSLQTPATPVRARTATTLPPPALSVAPSTPSAPVVKAKVGSEPETYDGKEKGAKSKAWLRKAMAYVKLNETRYPDDRDKILFFCGRLTGHAEKWAAPIFDAYNDDDYTYQNLNDLQAFTEAFEKNFGDPDAGHTAERQIQSLHQGNMRASEYTTKFNTIAYELVRWGQAPLMAIYRKGLRVKIQNVLATTMGPAKPHTLQALKDFAIELDNQLRENKVATKRLSGSTQKKPENKPEGGTCT
ncbi:retrotransposon gag protein [Rhizoctonia solani AG-3 Rhs1AP]|uniref:Retrotransposon gag protein n=1 Tax=Rhizoctonia solani AG-3 Rhs1AP TaxID=1086054 RepID=X8J3K2_9AGAM|nr:retrotransposon gag protein [Rhizoctonia solani AG-3 Rhs1AP]